MKTNQWLTSVHKHRFCLFLYIPPEFGKMLLWIWW